MVIVPLNKLHYRKSRNFLSGISDFNRPRNEQICDAVATHPLPMKVTRVTGSGEFFDRGDPIPRRATLSVQGVEEPLVGRLQFEELLSAAMSERARRRNDQVSHQLYTTNYC